MPKPDLLSPRPGLALRMGLSRAEAVLSEAEVVLARRAGLAVLLVAAVILLAIS